jgi:hypothetical protein
MWIGYEVTESGETVVSTASIAFPNKKDFIKLYIKMIPLSIRPITRGYIKMQTAIIAFTIMDCEFSMILKIQ